MSDQDSNIHPETKTIEAMIQIYCAGNKHDRDGERLCQDCFGLIEYASKRLVNCPFGIDKPNCNKCKIHCYKPQMRQKIQEVMRYSGPRMIKNHPVLAIKHLIKGLKIPK